METQRQESSNLEPINYAAEQRCVLCRNKVHFYHDKHWVDGNEQLRNIEDWETAVLALGCKQHFYNNTPPFPLVDCGLLSLLTGISCYSRGP